MRKTHAAVVLISLAAVAAGCDLLTPAMYKRDVTAVISGPSTLAVGATAQLTLTLDYSDGESRLLAPSDSGGMVLTSSNQAVATVSPMGLVTALSVGQTTITATPDVGTTGTGRLIPGSLVITVTP